MVDMIECCRTQEQLPYYFSPLYAMPQVQVSATFIKQSFDKGVHE